MNEKSPGFDSKIFIDRADRVPVRIPVFFRSAESNVPGHSINLSKSGILASFARPLDIWITGQLSILIPGHSIYVETRVARVEGCTAAMSFRNMSARDLQIIETFVEQTD